MLEMVQQLLESTNYIRVKREDELTYTLLPLLYFSGTNIVIYNKIGVKIEDNAKVISNLSDEDFEYVIYGNILNNSRNIELNVTDIKKYINRRKSKRFDVNKPTEIIINEAIIQAKLINLSQSGALISVEQKLEAGEKASIKLYDELFDSQIVRIDGRTGKSLYGVQFEKTCDVMKILKNYNVNTYKSDKNIYLLLDNFEDLEHYGKVFEKDVNLNFVNVINNFDGFIVNYLEDKKNEIIILDMNEENLIKYAEKLRSYINVEKVLLVLIEEDASDDVVNFLMGNNIPMLFKAFLETELSRLLLKMS